MYACIRQRVASTVRRNDDMSMTRYARYARFRCGKLSARLFPIRYSDAVALYRSFIKLPFDLQIAKFSISLMAERITSVWRQ